MVKVAIKSEKLSPFGGIFSIMEQFDSMLSPIIDQMFCDNKISVTSDTRNPATPPRGREAAAL